MLKRKTGEEAQKWWALVYYYYYYESVLSSTTNRWGGVMTLCVCACVYYLFVICAPACPTYRPDGHVAVTAVGEGGEFVGWQGKAQSASTRHRATVPTTSQQPKIRHPSLSSLQLSFLVPTTLILDP